MDEASKTRKIWGSLEKSIITGSGIDIGCGNDPITPEVQKFDVADGDANEITKFVHSQFDFVYSSHCLEHMRDPQNALLEWWKLVRPGGYIFFIVPDEDLYEQGIFPSRFNLDHKATFTISKTKSWSPKSINVLSLAQSLPNGELISLVLQDNGYDRSLYRHGLISTPPFFLRFILRIYQNFKNRRLLPSIQFLETIESSFKAVDQTRRPDALAQIQCIVRKQI